jgi:hypothetical protein
MSEKDPKRSGPRPIGDLVPASLQRSRTPVRDRLLGDPFLVDTDNDNTILYQHSVLCQTSLPFRDPGEEVRLWSRKNGRVRLEIQAGRAFDGARDDFIDVGLPFGAKPRLVLYHLNSEALRMQSPTIELEGGLRSMELRQSLHGRDACVARVAKRATQGFERRCQPARSVLAASPGECLCSCASGGLFGGVEMWRGDRRSASTVAVSFV